MEFREYLEGKKIDPQQFQTAEPVLYDEFFNLFNQVHPESFTQQKLFLINQIRRKYLFKKQGNEKTPTAKKMVKPKMNPLKPKTS